MSQRNWTLEQKTLLRDLWSTHKATELAQILGRTTSAVRSQIHYMRLGQSVGRWSQEETKKLVSIHKSLTIEEMARAMGKTPNSIARRMQRLNLRRQTNRWQYPGMTPSLAHLLGMTLTDGCLVPAVRNNSIQLVHVSIDKEYVEASMDAFADTCGNIYREPQRVTMTKAHRNQPWRIAMTCQDLNEWLAEQTHWKKKFPMEVWRADRESQLSFVAAMMDGDGYIAERDNSGCQKPVGYMIGFCSEDLWIFEFESFLNSLGVHTSHRTTQLKKSGKDFYYLHINKESFVRAGCYFRITRKMNKLLRYAELFMKLSPQRPHAPPLPQRMIWSVLQSDLQKPAEMTGSQGNLE